MGQLYAGNQWLYTWKRFDGEKEGAFDQDPMYLQIMFPTHLPVIVDALEVYEWKEHPFSDQTPEASGLQFRNGDVLEASGLQLKGDKVLATVSGREIPIKQELVKKLVLSGKTQAGPKPVTTFYTAYKGEVFPCESYSLAEGQIRARSPAWRNPLILPMTEVSEIVHHGIITSKPPRFLVTTHGGSRFGVQSFHQEGDNLLLQTPASETPIPVPLSAVNEVERLQTRKARLRELDQQLTTLTGRGAEAEKEGDVASSTLVMRDGSLMKVDLLSIAPEQIRVRAVWGEERTIQMAT